MSPDPARPDAPSRSVHRRLERSSPDAAQTTGPEVVALRPEPDAQWEAGKDAEMDYIGRVGAVSEHRTTGGRAWCHNDREWCYPSTGGACSCCDEPFARDEVIAHAEALTGERVREAEERIVTWLRNDPLDEGNWCYGLAEAIERGEHR